MDMNTYQAETAKTALYPGAGTGNDVSLAYCGLGLGEAGEVQGKIKKVIRDDAGYLSEEKRTEIAAELGDLLWYVARTAAEISVPLEDIAAGNLLKLESRRARGVIGGSGDNR